MTSKKKKKERKENDFSKRKFVTLMEQTEGLIIYSILNWNLNHLWVKCIDWISKHSCKHFCMGKLDKELINNIHIWELLIKLKDIRKFYKLFSLIMMKLEQNNIVSMNIYYCQCFTKSLDWYNALKLSYNLINMK